MQPLGRKKMRYNYVDCHPKKYGKGWANWWEVEINVLFNKKTDRQSTKKMLRFFFEHYQETKK